MKSIIALAAGLVLMAAPAFAVTDSGSDLALGSSVPAFSLPDVSTGKNVSPADFQGKKALVVVFMCKHCPYVVHVKKVLASLGSEYQAKDVAMVGISANDAAKYPDDAPASLAQMVEDEGFTFPLLYDEAQATAKAFGAKATPETFIFDGEQKLVYHGQMDSTRPNGDKEATGADVRAALDAILAGQPVSQDQKAAQGCSIKWKK